MRKPLNVLLVLGSAAALVMVSGPLAAQAAADGLGERHQRQSDTPVLAE
jgi:hypothetical protein